MKKNLGVENSKISLIKHEIYRILVQFSLIGKYNPEGPLWTGLRVKGITLIATILCPLDNPRGIWVQQIQKISFMKPEIYRKPVKFRLFGNITLKDPLGPF